MSDIEQIIQDMPKTSVYDISEYLKKLGYEDDGCGDANWECVSFYFENPDSPYTIYVSVDPFLNTLEVWVSDDTGDIMSVDYQGQTYKQTKKEYYR